LAGPPDDAPVRPGCPGWRRVEIAALDLHVAHFRGGAQRQSRYFQRSINSTVAASTSSGVRRAQEVLAALDNSELGVGSIDE
jgi:hypothetical protein